MEETEALRGLASHWSLHGDDRLLSTLEKLHQKVVRACASSDARLGALGAALAAADLALRTLSDRFASLSNSQFVERRVYDDDADIRTDDAAAEQTGPVREAQPGALAGALAALRARHGAARLPAASDSDEDACEVLKLKDMYSERPLPHVIGTQRWRMSCFPESHSESEDDSSDEEYWDRPTHNSQSSESSRSADDEPFPQSRDVHSRAAQEVEVERERPSVTKVEEKQIYIQTPQPAYVPRPLIPRPEPDVFRTEPPPLPPDTEMSEDEEEEHEDSERKPIGGVSIFGTNKPSEISTAILCRKRRDSTSGDETDDLPTDTPELNTNSHKNDIFDHLFAKSEKLQNKNVNKKQEVDKVDSKISKKVAKPAVKPKVDIFSGNMFDDIDDDDIFASAPIKIPKVAENVTSKPVPDDLFEDDDDLFKDIAVTKTATNKTTPGNKIPGIKAMDSTFDSDDELFGSTSKTQISTKPKVKVESIGANNEIVTKINKQVRSIFDDSEEELFSDNIMEIKPSNEVSSKNTPKVDVNKLKETKSLFDDSDDELFTYNDTNDKNISHSSANNTVIEKPTLFQDDKAAHYLETKPVANESNKNTINVQKKEVMASPNLFDDEEEMLFNESKILNKNTHSGKEDVIENVIPNDDKNKFERPDINKDPKVTEIDTFDNNTNNIKNSPEIREVNDDKLLIPDKVTKIQGDIFDKVDDNDIFKKEIPITADLHTKTVDKLTIDKVINKNNSKEDIFDNSFDSNSENAEPVNKFIKNTNVTKNNDEYFEIQKSNSVKEVDNKLDIIKQDVFSDIFDDIPPEFEKPKESKKSKNVNALFDDDSDDESLFFKKNDNFDDLPPKISEKSDTKNENLFDLFLDEPPKLNVDFTQRDKNNKDTLSTDITVAKDDKQTDKRNPQQDVISKPDIKENVIESNKVKTIGSIFENDDFDEELFGKAQDKTIKNYDKVQDSLIIKPLTENKNILDSISNESITDDIDNAIINAETKKIGKLKPINININVNTLRPGASLKKTSEQTDGQMYSMSNEELHITKTENNANKSDIESKLVKSVSFEGNPDSSVLDNKLSKERAKIQVKRRPSTRKARKEAARVSGIQFPDDSTDNSSSIDDYNKNEDRSDKHNKTYDYSSRVTRDVTDFGDSNKDEGLIDTGVDLINDVTKIEQKFDRNEQLQDNTEVSLPSDDFNVIANVSSEESTAKSEEAKIAEEKHDIIESPTISNDENDINTNINRDIKSPVKEIKDNVLSKIVYVLNDEDIFSNSTQPDEVKKVEEKTKPKVLNIIDDDDDDGDDLFKYMATAGSGRNTSEVKIKKETKTETKKEKSLFNSGSDDYFYKEKLKDKQNVKLNKEVKTDKVNIKAKKPNKSIFGDSSDSDDELFKPKTKKFDKKPTIFDSNSEDELFGKGKKEAADKTSKDRKRDTTVKESLFGDDDDDDLFTNKPSKGAPETDSSDADPLRAHR